MSLNLTVLLRRLPHLLPEGRRENRLRPGVEGVREDAGGFGQEALSGQILKGGGGQCDKVKDHLFSFIGIQDKVVAPAPDSKEFDRLSVSALLIVMDQPNHCCVIGVFNDMVKVV